MQIILHLESFVIAHNVVFFLSSFFIYCDVFCSHKREVLQFLDQLASFYEQEYILSSGVTESYQVLIDKVSQLADANGLPSKGYESSLSGFSAENLRSYLTKVCLFDQFSSSVAAASQTCTIVALGLRNCTILP